MSFWLWDEQAALDYLGSLPYVNASMMGVAGCSGGGTQASYIGAMDPRIQAASIACYISTFRVCASTTEDVVFSRQIQRNKISAPWKPPHVCRSIVCILPAVDLMANRLGHTAWRWAWISRTCWKSGLLGPLRYAITCGAKHHVFTCFCIPVKILIRRATFCLLFFAQVLITTDDTWYAMLPSFTSTI